MYEEELNNNGMAYPSVNKTRFKEHLLAAIPDLVELKSGRQVSLQMNTDAGRALYEAAKAGQGG